MLKSLILSLLAGWQVLMGMNQVENLSQKVAFLPEEAGQEVSQTVDQSLLESRPVAPIKKTIKAQQTSKVQVDYLKKLADLGITIHPGKEYASDSKDDPSALNHCASLVYQTLKIVPAEAASKVKNLTLYFNSTGRRGLGGGSTIILRCQNVSDSELVSVLVHELGHVEDTGVLLGSAWSGASKQFKDGQNTINGDDPSLDFYKISFDSDSNIKKDAQDDDFVSGYAKSDPFEDFAETFNFYLLHGENFRLMAAENNALQLKYSFMKEKVFGGKEYDFDVTDPELLSNRQYDATLVSYNFNKFLAI